MAKGVANSGRNVAKYGAGVGILAGLGILEKVPQGFEAVRVHNGNITRSRDSWLVPEWKKGTLFGHYGAGLHIKPPFFQHFELLDMRDTPASLKIQVLSKSDRPENRRVHDIAATVVWGVPEEFDGNDAVRDLGVAYSTILVRALTRAGNHLNDRQALGAMVATICKGGLRMILQDYDDPTRAESGEVHESLVREKSEELLDYGAELRNTILEETAPSPAQLLKDGMTVSLHNSAALTAVATEGGEVIPLSAS